MTIDKAIEVMYGFGDLFVALNMLIPDEQEVWDEMERAIFSFYKEHKEGE